MKNESEETELLQAWREAASSLSVRVEAPYIIKAANGEAIECVAYLPDFGGPKGMVIGIIAPPEFQTNSALKLAAESLELFYSFINRDVYRKYQEEIFKEALRDWGYQGSESLRPFWVPRPVA